MLKINLKSVSHKYDMHNLRRRHLWNDVTTTAIKLHYSDTSKESAKPLSVYDSQCFTDNALVSGSVIMSLVIGDVPFELELWGTLNWDEFLNLCFLVCPLWWTKCTLSPLCLFNLPYFSTQIVINSFNSHFSLEALL